MKRQRIDLNLEAVGPPSATRSTRGKTQAQLPSSPRGGRAAKTRANQRLDAQARDIAEFQRQMSGSRSRATSIIPRKPAGIRVSARLRGTVVEDDEWQEVPDEWLAASDSHQRHVKDPPSGSSPASKKKMKTGLESEDSSISELTELSDGEDDATGTERDAHEGPVVDADKTNPPIADKCTDAEIEEQQDGGGKLTNPHDMLSLPEDFVEWETVGILAY